MNALNRIVFVVLLMGLSLVVRGQGLLYDRPAKCFEEALPIGNGTMGAMVYGGYRECRFSLNDITLWTGEPSVDTLRVAEHIPAIREALWKEDYATANELNKRIEGHYSENYQPLGWLSLLFADSIEPQSYVRQLDIAQALCEEPHFECFASAPDSVIVIRTKMPLKELHFESPLPCTIQERGNEIIVDGYTAYHSLPHYLWGVEPKFFYDSTRGIHFRTLIKRVGNMVLVSNATSFSSPHYQQDVRRRIDGAARKGYKTLKKRHIRDYQSLYGRFDLSLGRPSMEDMIRATIPTTDQWLRSYSDSVFRPGLEALYVQYGRYLMISSSRTQGVPMNLQGLWNEQLLPPWSSNYTVNINLEENYWPAEPAGLGVLHRQSLIEFIRRLQPHGERTARDYYGVGKGWCLGHNSDIWAMTNPVGLQEGDPSWACWNMGGAWLATHLWEHYAFSLDEAYLREIYPVLRGAADFCMDWLVEKEGRLLTAPSTSPENIFLAPDGYRGATLYGATADLAIIRECLLDTRMAARILGYDTDSITLLLSRLEPYRVGSGGHLQEWYHDWTDADPQHRHQSHLFGLYPGHHMPRELHPACAKTLETKGFETTGWSCGWRINLYARLSDGEKAYRMFRRLLRYVEPTEQAGGTYPNLLDAHAPFQIDGNFGGAAGVIEMLIQSELSEDWQSSVRLLPALPSCWAKEGHLYGVRVRGGFEVDFAWKEGKITELRVRNLTKTHRKINIDCGADHWETTAKPGQWLRITTRAPQD